MNKKLLPIFIGLFVLVVSACASNAAPAPVQPAAPTAVPSSTSAPAPSDLSGSAGAMEQPTATATASAPPPPAPAGAVSFTKDIMPIFQNSCVKCHGIEAIKKGLDMTSYDKLMAGSFEGPVIVAGDANQSPLADVLVRGKMPKRGDPLPQDQIQLIINWINAGAPNN